MPRQLIHVPASKEEEKMKKYESPPLKNIFLGVSQDTYLHGLIRQQRKLGGIILILHGRMPCEIRHSIRKKGERAVICQLISVQEMGKAEPCGAGV